MHLCAYGAPVFTLILIALTAAPRALPEAEVVTFVPRLDRTADSVPFFKAAGTRVSMLRPESWRDLTHPLVQFDPTSAESIKASGIDQTGSLTLSQRGELDVSCVTLSDVKAYETACEPRLKSHGDLTRITIAGATVVSTKDQLGRVLLAYALKGKISCAATNHGLSLEKVLPELAKLVSASKTPTEPGFKAAAELPGVMSVIRPSGAQSGAVSLTTNGLSATLDAQTTGAASSLTAKPGLSVFAQSKPAGLAVLRLRLTTAHLGEAMSSFLRRVPGGTAMQQQAEALGPLMTGNVLVFIDRAEVTGSLGTDQARFRALKMAILIETTDGEAAKTALSTAPVNARKDAPRFGVTGALATFSNDETALSTALASVAAAPSKQGHALEAIINPTMVARGLAQVPLLDAIQNPALAGLLAAGTELGPLLLASETLTGWADPTNVAGIHRAQLTWPLRADRFH